MSKDSAYDFYIVRSEDMSDKKEEEDDIFYTLSKEGITCENAGSIGESPVVAQRLAGNSLFSILNLSVYLTISCQTFLTHP